MQKLTPYSLGALIGKDLPTILVLGYINKQHTDIYLSGDQLRLILLRGPVLSTVTTWTFEL